MNSALNVKIDIIGRPTSYRDKVGALLQEIGLTVQVCGDAEKLSEAPCVLATSRVDHAEELISEVTDHRMPADLVVVCPRESAEEIREALGEVAGDVIPDSCGPLELRQRIARVYSSVQARRELKALKQLTAMNFGWDEFVGRSEAVVKARETAQRIAPTSISMHIFGPSGSGKTLLAQMLYLHSERRRGPLQSFDFSAVPSGDQSGFLFDPVRSDSPLAGAHAGTLVLENLDFATVEAQDRLFRFLQTCHWPERCAESARKLDVRIISTSTVDIDELAEAGTFRKDLWCRLAEMSCTLPPLSDRPEDIELLTAHGLRRLSREHKREEITIAPEALARLCHYDWPGNVRELQNTLRRAVAFCRNGTITPDDIRLLSEIQSPSDDLEGASKSSLIIKGGLLDESQRSLIMRALNDNDWNYTKTAANLGIGRTTLWRKIRKYNLKEGAPVE
jgi:DNA-binding NtrC family response regulator